jgi:solute carrier family 25 phosphate transporter 3
MLAGGCAEVIASSFLSPFEAARIRLVSNPAFANGLVPCLRRISTEEGSGALFFGLPAILAKQVPYTILQLSTFDSFSTSISRSGLLADRFTISLIAALAAAVLFSLASQPGDTLLSIVNTKARSSSSSPSSSDSASASASDASSINALSIISEAVAELGFKGLFRGTQARLVHVGVIVVSQLLIYDSIKQSLGIPIGGH